MIIKEIELHKDAKKRALELEKLMKNQSTFAEIFDLSEDYKAFLGLCLGANTQTEDEEKTFVLTEKLILHEGDMVKSGLEILEEYKDKVESFLKKVLEVKKAVPEYTAKYIHTGAKSPSVTLSHKTSGLLDSTCFSGGAI